MSKHGAMNRIYRVVWNAALGVWQAVSEIGKSRKKNKTRKVCIATPELAGLLKHLHPVRIGLMLGSLLLVSPSVYAAALPQNGVVTSGVGSINQSNANTLNITQATDKMAIDWQSFSVGQGNTVNFIQPSTSAIALNRVIGNDVSHIQGAINANGQVFLINPNGVLFSTTAQVNVGSLVASTRNITNEQFNAGDYRFEGHSSSAIINQGNIKVADGGYVVMIAAKIDNSGSISANQGTVAMAAGNLVTLDMGGPVKLKVEQGNIDALIKNGGAIQAEGGHILLTAKAAGDLAASVINNSGKIEASSISEVGGQIVLLGDDITNSGSLAANGATGGGEVLIGGDWQGSNAEIYPHATKVTLTETSVVSADATENGDGGKVVAWSDISNAESITSVSGTISAKGGENGGDGGQIETSGALLITEGVTGSAAAPMGKAGEWLFDPTNVTIGTSGTASAQNNGTTISASSIASLLNGGTSVTVTTSSGSGELGDLTVNNTITKSSGNNDVTLTLRAANSIVINQAIENSGGNGKLHLVIDADNNTAASTSGLLPDRDGGGITILEANLSTRGGNVTFGGTAAGTGGIYTGGDLFVGGSSAVSITTNGGSVDVKGNLIIANSSSEGFAISTNGGAIDLRKAVDSGNQYTAVSGAERTWQQARDHAKAQGGWLATIGSSLENALAIRAAGYSAAWLGGQRIIGTNEWRWTQDPAYNATSNPMVFFYQGTSSQTSLGGTASGSGGTTATGFFANWSGWTNGSTPAGEPNNWDGHYPGVFSQDYESALQFTGNRGLWNDLPTNNNQLNQYVRETNLAPSRLQLNAGSGAVNIGGAVGSSKALSQLNVTSSNTSVTGNSIITTGAQTYSGSLTVNNASSTSPVTLQGAGITAGEVAVYGGTIKVNSNITTSANNGNILLQGQTSIESDSPTRALTSGSGNITLLTNNLVHTNSNKLNLTTTGVLTFAPYGAAWTDYGGTLNFAGSFSGQNFTGSGDAGGLNINNFSSLGGLTLGKAGTTTGIAIDTALSLAGPISLIGGELSLNKAVTTSDTLSLTSSANISQSNLQADALSANSVVLLGGNVTLNNPYNNANTLAASGVSGLAYSDANALTIGTVGSTDGISATGVVSVATQTGDLTLAQNITTTDTSVSALTLNAGANEAAGTTTGGNILMSGSPVISLGANGVARLFSASVSGSTGLTELIGESSGRFRYNSDESTANYSRSLLAGLNAIYREAIAVEISGMALSMTYGEALPSISATGTVNGDGSVYAITDRVISSSGHIKASATDYVINEGLSELGYSVTGTTSGTLTVNTKALTVDGLTIADKTYNGSAEASTSAAGSLAGLVTGDAVTFSTAASFNSKDVEATKTVNLDHTLDGADKDNYSLVDQTAVATDAKINAKALTLSASKTYDGSADLTGFVTLTGFVGSETLAYSGATASDKHVATADKYINAITLADGGNGGLASNYQLPTLNATNAAVTINPATLTPTLTNTGVTKVYDGTTKAPVSGTPTWSFAGLVAGDSAATLNYTGAAYNSKDVDAANAITVSGLTIDSISGTNGSYASDYVLDANSKTVAATITPAALTVIANNDAKFVTQNDPTFTANYSGFVNGETTDVLGGALTITRSNVGTDTAGTYSDVLVASGYTSSNYAITYQNGNFTIVPSDQLLVRVTNVSDTYGTATQYAISTVEYYDAGSSSVIRLDDNSVSGSSVAINASNEVTVTDGSSATANFTLAPESAQTSSASLLKVGSYQLGVSGTVTENSANFNDTITVVGAHQVNQKGITALASGVSKVYDGTTDMTGVTLGLSTLETNDVVIVNGMGAFSSKNVGSNLSYTVSNLALNGADAGNYYLSAGSSLSGNDGEITAKALTLTNVVANNKVYDGSATATVSADLAGLVAVDSGAVSVAIAATFADKNVGTNKTVTVNSVTLSGTEATNYSIATSQPSQTANITRLDSVTWIGGPTGDWFNPTNWSGGAVPDLANVANVIIPEHVTVSFDTAAATGGAQTGAVEIDSLGSSNGALTQTNGTLNIGSDGVNLAAYTQNGGTFTNAGNTTLNRFSQTNGSFSSSGSFTTANFNQSGGTTALADNLTVTEDFAQGASGSVTVAGNTNITDTTGGAVIGNLNTNGTTIINSSGGAISQANGTAFIAHGTTSLTANNGANPANISLNSATNNFVGEVSANGANITLVDGVADLLLADITASGKLDARATNNLQLNGVLNVDSAELIATNGDIRQGENSTLAVTTGETDLSAGGEVRLDKANDFNGAVNIADATNVVLNDSNALVLGDLAISGTLDVIAQNNITQKPSTGIVTGGDVNFSSTDGDVTLDSASNNFGGRFDANGQQVALTNYNQPLSLGDIVAQTALNIVTNNQPITQAANTTIKSKGTSAMDAGSSTIALTNSANDYGAITLNAAQVTRAETLSEVASRLSAEEAARLAAEAEEVKRDAIANAQQQAAATEAATKTTNAVTNINVKQLVQLAANSPLAPTEFKGVSTASSGDFNLVFVSTEALSASLDEKGVVDVNLDDMSSLMRFLEANNLLEQGRLVVVNNGIRLPFLLTRQEANF